MGTIPSRGEQLVATLTGQEANVSNGGWGPHPWRTQVSDAQRARRVHPWMLGEPCRPQAQGDRIDPRPAYIERVLGRTATSRGSTPGLRDELLNGEIFYSLREAQIVIESWRRHYNTIRPHALLDSSRQRRSCSCPASPRGRLRYAERPRRPLIARSARSPLNFEHVPPWSQCFR